MNIDEACALLDRRNPYSEELAWALRFMHDRDPLVIKRKGGDLVEVVQWLKTKGCYPVVDKGLRLILGLGYAGHGYPREGLFQYYYHAKDPGFELPHIGFGAADRYIIEGYGYFISSMRPDAIVVGRKYRPDRFDKDLFAMYELDFI